MPVNSNYETRLQQKELARVLLLLSGVLVLGTLGYAWIEGWSILDSLYMTVITVTTVGFGEVIPLSDAGRWFTILLVCAGVATGFAAAGVLGRAVLSNSPLRARKRMQKAIDQLSDHVILCGHGRLGHIVRRELELAERPFVVVESDEDVFHNLAEERVMCIQGDATEEAVLRAAGVERAAGVIAAIGSEVGNVFITLTTRELNTECSIVARAENPSTEDKLKRVGATRVVTPYALGGRRLAQAFLRPGAVDLADLAIGCASSKHEMLIEEIPLSAVEGSQDRSLASLQLRTQFGLIAVGVRHASDGELYFNPPADKPLHTGDRLMVLGEREQLDAFLDSLS